jgi:Kef-type K+ transport system membrane component KefB
MVRQGPIPAFVHGLWEYIAGAGLIVAPLLLGYNSGAAKAVSIILGVLLIFLAATSSSSTSLVNQVSLPAHIILDYVLVAILIASPFLFGFSGESTPTAIFIGGGIVHMLISIGTRYRKEEKVERGTPKRKQRAALARPARDAVRDDEIPEYKPPPRQP